MANQTKAQQWTERVAEWRASGLSAKAYCVGREFNHRDLYRWRHRLEHAAPVCSVTLARLESARRSIEITPAPPTSATLTIEVGVARVAIPAGVDGATLRTVLEALAATSRRGGRL
jgi:hypothetical protein